MASSSSHFQSRLFNQPIIKLWNIIKDITVTTKMLSNPALSSNELEPIFLKGFNSYESNSQFIIPINKDRITQVEEVIETDYFCRIKRVVYNKQMAQVISIEINSLHYIEEYFTLLFTEYKIYSLIQSRVKLKDIQSYYLNQIERGIMSRQYTKTKYTGKKINASYDLVMSFISNTEVMAKSSGEVFETINTRHKKEPNMCFYMNMQQKDIIRIIVKHRNYTSDAFVVHLLLTNENRKSPSREIIVQLHKINEDESFVIYRHNFLEEVSDNKMEYIAKLAPMLLDSLDKIIKQFKALNMDKSCLK